MVYNSPNYIRLPDKFGSGTRNGIYGSLHRTLLLEITYADRESRISNIEWELAPRLFESIVTQFGRPELDLFASRVNGKCEKFCSWYGDPEAFCVDVFTFDWGEYDFYAFPPFALILRVLTKIQIDQVQGIVVVPAWKTQPWFPLWQSLLVESAIQFSLDNANLLSPCRTIQHLLASKLTLMAGFLSGKRSGDRI